jgi:hypothetical protein
MRILTLLLILISPSVFSQNEKSKVEYPKNVGNIEFDPKTDNKDFVICQEQSYDGFQYFFEGGGGFDYAGEKLAIENEFKKSYDSKKTKKESGFVRIRFIINCQGKTDRFRVLSVNENYKAKEFDKNITEQLLQITKKLDGWKPKKYEGKDVNYYQYLIFKIYKGQLTEVLP